MKRIIITAFFFLPLIACKKFLDERPDKNLVIPSRVEDLEALLDHNNSVNSFSNGIAEASADNYYLKDATWASLADNAREIYIWGPEIFFETYRNAWDQAYVVVNISNYVLETLPKVESQSSPSLAATVKGTALFHRARIFHVIATGWANQYDVATATTDFGIPLRLSSDFTEKSVRSTVEQTYTQITSDLKGAIQLLPVTPKHVMQPSKPAAYALMARVLLSMRKYSEAMLYADSCLQLKNTLIDFKTLNAAATYPVPAYNAEVIFHSTSTIGMLSSANARIDSTLYISFHTDDVRRAVFFLNNTDGTKSFRGSFSGAATLFAGITVGEMLLTKAECQARDGEVAQSMSTLNSFLVKRWKATGFVPRTAANQADAVKMVLEERRKELIFRDLRWMDLKRLNKDLAYQKTVKRFLNGQFYELLPNSPKYALPFPEVVIQQTGMPQNPR